MTWLDVRVDEIPPRLRTLPYVGWRGEVRGAVGKPTKVPFRIAAPRIPASSTDPSTWSTFDDAASAYSCRELGFDGIGSVLTLAERVSCIDLDGVIDDDGRLDTRAETIVDRAESWTEISPGGRGLHVFVLGTIPRALKGSQIEIYSTARYIAITGHRWPGTPSDLRDAQGYLDALHVKACDSESRRRSYTGSSTPPPDDLAGALLARLQTWGIPVARLKRWEDGFLVELAACPWSSEHTTGPGGAAVMIRASGAYDFVCQHAHCGQRRWREFRAVMEPAR